MDPQALLSQMSSSLQGAQTAAQQGREEAIAEAKALTAAVLLIHEDLQVLTEIFRAQLACLHEHTDVVRQTDARTIHALEENMSILRAKAEQDRDDRERGWD